MHRLALCVIVQFRRLHLIKTAKPNNDLRLKISYSLI